MSIEGARSIEANRLACLSRPSSGKQNRVTIQTTILIRYAVDRRGRLADYLLLPEKTLHSADRIGFMLLVLQRFLQVVEKPHELKPETAAVAPVSHAKYPIKRV